MDGEWTVPGYRHLHMLGEGASGRVMQGEHLGTGTPVAIKYLSAELVDDEEFLVRFRDEAHLLGELRDKHLVLFHEYIEGLRGAAIVMELVDGVSLAQLLNSEGATQPEAALTVLKGSLLGLAALHEAGVVHRDYKPGNVLVGADGNSKLADVGIAVRAGENVPSAGTPSYMPPEQWGGRPVSPATDVYAATAVFYECLTGERPYPERTLPQLALAHRTAAIPVVRVPEPMRSLVRHGLAKDPFERPPSAEAFLNELEAEAYAAYGSDWEERGRSQLKERVALLALLFPIERPAEEGTTAMGLSELGEGSGSSGGGKVRIGLMGAVGVLLVLVLGGGGAIVYASSTGSSTPVSKPKQSPPTFAPTGDPSGDPSGAPSDSASPSATPTTSPTPAPTTAAPTPTPATTPPATPKPTPTKPKPKPTPPKTNPNPKPTPFKISGVGVSVSAPDLKGSGSFTVTVSTAGGPNQTVSLTISGSGAQPSESSATLTSAPYTYPGTYFGGFCRDATITVSASPGNVTGVGQYVAANDPACIIR